MKKLLVTVASVTLTAILASPGQAQMRGKYSGGIGGHVVERRDYDVRATDLAPVFPDSHACDPVASPYGSPHRHDGSVRRQDRNSGLHGGLDISLVEGTPLLAIAAGKVIAKGEGGNLEGFYLWMLHAPEDTGLRFWSFIKYQHLVALPAVNPGDRVSAGQVVAHSGMSGTIGPAFGPQGYPHLHVSLHVAPGPGSEQQDTSNSFMPPKGGKLADPMLMFLPADRDFAGVEDLPAAEKRLPVAALARDGRIHPAGSKVVWPVYCSTRAG
ncbi:MAG: M23 family metallopeptidase [Rhodocyclales bacterium]|nr:M23 family metallopeptidase [Rhodocyclales bacterium]